ncbi:EamA/RhaT family transporter [Streptomyces sp. YC504]|uniref:EamA/RhaT family transporter n=1 Tax=Streptomyces mesophilus TaxID=1775132 RepID=A0A6G4XST0_9ACTN|nr:EamA/RhaT family transporter [Streptomyces mesophilus]NGO80625.1 EamA/RhaT family transporter [Streptomyces mesophilus]
MSDENGTNETPTAPAGPQPEELPLFGTTWLNHDGGYLWRRIGAGLGSLALAAAGAFVLRFAFEGLEIAKVGDFVNVLVIVAFSACSAIAFRRAWESYGKRTDPDTTQSAKGLMAIGFIGVLLAYFFRNLYEAPGEKLRRTEYETARTRYERRSSRRAGNPKKKRRG